MIERHTFYVIHLPKVNWGLSLDEDDFGPGYFSQERGGTYAKDLGLARRYTKLGAARMLAKEKMLCPKGNAEMRKVEATYFME